MAVHHLVHAAHEILTQKSGKNFLINESFFTEEGKKVFRRAFLKSKNFIKHADKDRDEILEFSPDINIILLLDCAYMLHGILGDNFLPAKMYIFWCASTEPGFFLVSFLMEIDKLRSAGFEPSDFDFIAESLKAWVKSKLTGFPHHQ